MFITLRILLGFCCLPICLAVYGQQKLCGYITDQVTGEVLVGATCYIKESNKNTTANNRGFFCIEIENELDSLEISYIGYITKKISPKLHRLSENNIFQLQKANYLLGEVVVGVERNFERTLSGHINLDIEKIKSIPSIAGESDLLKAITVLPGITGGREGYSNLHIRGGSRDQNLILLDGSVINTTNHMGGFISMFNPEVIKNVSIYKAGFPARYGDRLSSVIDVRTRSGNINKFNGNFKIGVISSSILIEGPVFKEKSSFLFGIRRSYLDLITFPNRLNYYKYNSGQYSLLRFHDINFKYTHHISTTTTLELNIYHGADNITNKEKSQRFLIEDQHLMQENNSSFSLVFSKELKTNLFLISNLNSTSYNYNLENYRDLVYNDLNDRFNENYQSDRISENREYRWKTYFDFWISGHNLKSGLELSSLSYSFGFDSEEKIISLQDSSIIKENTINDHSMLQRGNQASFFIEDEFGIGQNLNLNIGLRYSSYIHLKNYERFSALEPRLSTRFAINELQALKFSYMYAKQYSLALVESVNGFETEKWVSSNSLVPPQEIHQISIGYFLQIPKIVSELSIESYYKKMSNLIESNLSLTQRPDYSNWEEFVISGGNGRSYGVEVSIERNSKMFKSSLFYSLSWNHRQFSQLNFGRWYPFTYERRHVIDILLVFPIPRRKFDVSVLWTYQSGHAYSIPTGFVPETPFSQGYFSYSSINNGNLPNYHRLDLALNRRWRTKKNRSMILSFNIYNVYNRANAVFFYVDRNNEVNQISQFPVFPSISIEVGLTKSKEIQ